MTAKDAIRQALTGNHAILTMYLADLSDSDLLVRPVPEANHIAWQLGHMIAAEGLSFPTQIPGGRIVELPAGFAEQHGKDTSASDATTGWLTKAQYLELFDKVRASLLETLDKLPEADLDKPITGRMARIAPTVGAMFLLAANHEMMHAGQFSVVRRKLGKPVLF